MASEGHTVEKWGQWEAAGWVKTTRSLNALVSSEEFTFGMYGSIVWTTNVVLWDSTSSIVCEGGGGGDVYETLYSDTYWDASSIFNLQSFIYSANC
eukprot:scaffold2474_cov234-Ochromonas_danica.AAC.3